MAKILIVEDDEAFLETLRRSVEQLGHQVVVTRNGHEALNAFEEFPADLVITDLLMPDKDGFETIRELRKRYKRVRFIAISGGGRIEAARYLELAEHLGAWQTLAKPFTRDQLETAINHVLSQPDDSSNPRR